MYHLMGSSDDGLSVDNLVLKVVALENSKNLEERDELLAEISGGLSVLSKIYYSMEFNEQGAFRRVLEGYQQILDKDRNDLEKEVDSTTRHLEQLRTYQGKNESYTGSLEKLKSSLDQVVVSEVFAEERPINDFRAYEVTEKLLEELFEDGYSSEVLTHLPYREFKHQSKLRKAYLVSTIEQEEELGIDGNSVREAIEDKDSKNYNYLFVFPVDENHSIIKPKVEYPLNTLFLEDIAETCKLTQRDVSDRCRFARFDVLKWKVRGEPPEPYVKIKDRNEEIRLLYSH
jgi:hypothetical protein